MDSLTALHVEMVVVEVKICVTFSVVVMDTIPVSQWQGHDSHHSAPLDLHLQRNT